MPFQKKPITSTGAVTKSVFFTSGSQVPGTQKSLSKCLLNGSANTAKTWKMGSWTFQGELGYRERIEIWKKRRRKNGDTTFNFVFLPLLSLFSSKYHKVVTGRPYLLVDMVCKWLLVQDKISAEREHNYLGTFTVIWHCLTSRHVIPGFVLLSSV